MRSEVSPGKTTTRRYSPAEKEQAVRLVRALRRAGAGNRELKRVKEILKRGASFFGVEIDRRHKK